MEWLILHASVSTLRRIFSAIILAMRVTKRKCSDEYAFPVLNNLLSNGLWVYSFYMDFIV
jgi:hypothetical protein